MSLFDGIGGAIGDLAGSLVQHGLNMQSMDKQMDRQAFWRANAYQVAARDLDKAGLNRILALGSPASTPGGSALSVSAPQLGTSYNSARAAALQREILQEQAENLRVERMKTGAEMELADQQRHESRAREMNYGASSALMVAQRLSELERPPFIRAQTDTERSRPALVRTQTATEKQRARTSKSIADTSEFAARIPTSINPLLDAIVNEVLRPTASGAGDFVRKVGEAVRSGPDGIKRFLRGTQSHR